MGRSAVRCTLGEMRSSLGNTIQVLCPVGNGISGEFGNGISGVRLRHGNVKSELCHSYERQRLTKFLGFIYL